MPPQSAQGGPTSPPSGSKKTPLIIIVVLLLAGALAAYVFLGDLVMPSGDAIPSEGDAMDAGVAVDVELEDIPPPPPPPPPPGQ